MRHAHWQRNARALAAGNVLINIGWNASFAFLPLIVESLGVVRNLALWVGAMMFGYHAVSCVFTPVWGVLADHYGRKSMVLRAGFGMAAGFGVLSITSDPLLFLIVMVLTGLANGYVPAGQALVATSTPREHMGGALALTQAGAAGGMLLGPLVGAALLAWLPTSQLLFSFTAIAMWQITSDGEATMFEGLALVATYVILATITLFERSVCPSAVSMTQPPFRRES